MSNYRLLDTGNRKKLEQVGDFRLIRPALNAAWKPMLPAAEWERAYGIFERDSSGGGTWAWFNRRVPESWLVEWGGFTLKVKPTGFGHLGFFAEQYHNWDWLQKKIRSMASPCRTLNLFAYSGIASMAMAAAGAEVCHLDAARGMNDWGRENQQLNAQVPDTIRWIADDVMKFVERERRRGNRYHGIVLDPPSFGRGPKGQVWKLEDSAVELLESCRAIMATDQPHFVLLSCHSPGFSPLVLERLLEDVFSRSAHITSGEMTIPDGDDRVLPAGIFACLESR
ncbi:MAG: class I SAM-dependent methyltransferase [Victivallales bacterium]|nr:class I SAM-dependent methyltransferase [Victivallales bacterium]